MVGDSTERGELPLAGMALLLVKSDSNLTRLGFTTTMESGRLAGNSQSLLERCSSVWSRFPGGLQACSPAGLMLMWSFCCWCELVIT